MKRFIALCCVLSLLLAGTLAIAQNTPPLRTTLENMAAANGVQVTASTSTVALVNALEAAGVLPTSLAVALENSLLMHGEANFLTSMRATGTLLVTLGNALGITAGSPLEVLVALSANGTLSATLQDDLTEALFGTEISEDTAVLVIDDITNGVAPAAATADVAAANLSAIGIAVDALRNGNGISIGEIRSIVNNPDFAVSVRDSYNRAASPTQPDDDRGHGNDPDGCDEDNPGIGKGPKKRCP